MIGKPDAPGHGDREVAWASKKQDNHAGEWLLVEYADGVKATMLLLNGLVGDFTFAARIKGLDEPLSTLFYLPPNPNVVYSAALMSKAEEMFLTNKAPYPIQRTLLTTGLVEAGMRSLAADGKRLETPHLAIRYQAPRQSQSAACAARSIGCTISARSSAIRRRSRRSRIRSAASRRAR